MIKAFLLILGAAAYLYIVDAGTRATTTSITAIKNLYTDPQGLPQTNILANR